MTDPDTTTNSDFIILEHPEKIDTISHIYIHTINNITNQFKMILSTITSSYNNTLSSITSNSNKNIQESSENTPLSITNSPWPVLNHSSPCYLCHYYGHGNATCPNITENMFNKCIRCFNTNHLSTNCSQKEQSPIPFKKNYKSPIKFL